VAGAQAVSFYRFLNHRRVSLSQLIETRIQRHGVAQVTGHVLAIQETTSLNVRRHRGRLCPTGLGYLGGGAGQHVGLHLHPRLLLTADSSPILGLRSLQVRTRQEGSADRRRRYKRLPLEQKESCQWLPAAAETKQKVPPAQRLPLVADRAADG